MKRAEPQLQAFPRSDNERRRQSARRPAVVSIRLLGAVIQKLDNEAQARSKTEGRTGRKRLTRTDIVKRAIDAYLTKGR